MAAFTVVASIAFYMVFIIGLVVRVNKRNKDFHRQSQYKLTDAELFKMMTAANHFISAQQLATATALSLKEASAKLQHLSTQKVIRKFNNSKDQTSSLFQLKEAVPLIESLPANIHQLNEDQIIEFILMHVQDYQVTVAELVVLFGVDIYEAKNLIKRLRDSGHVNILRKGIEHVYMINLKKNKMAIPSNLNRQQAADKIKIADLPTNSEVSDADVLRLAIKNKGIVTPTSLCVYQKIPINLAKLKLEQLHEEGAFVLDVNEKNLVVEYHLKDKSILSD